MGMTFAQKMLAAKAGLDSIDVGQIVEIEPDACLSHDNTAAIAKKFAQIGVERVKDPDKFVIVLDHRKEEHNELRSEIASWIESLPSPATRP